MMRREALAEAALALVAAMAARGLHPLTPGAVVAALIRGGLVRFNCRDAIGPKAWAILIDAAQPHGCFGSWRNGTSGTWRADTGDAQPGALPERQAP